MCVYVCVCVRVFVCLRVRACEMLPTSLSPNLRFRELIEDAWVGSLHVIAGVPGCHYHSVTALRVRRNFRWLQANSCCTFLCVPSLGAAQASRAQPYSLRAILDSLGSQVACALLYWVRAQSVLSTCCGTEWPPVDVCLFCRCYIFETAFQIFDVYSVRGDAATFSFQSSRCGVGVASKGLAANVLSRFFFACFIVAATSILITGRKTRPFCTLRCSANT